MSQRVGEFSPEIVASLRLTAGKYADWGYPVP